ncbi:MAG: F0F1 ATP synthase subunit epsilon [Candidatus Methylomirabilota bacterium]
MAEGLGETFRLEVVTTLRVLVDQDVTELVAPGSEGYFGVLPGRAPFATILKAGELTYRTGREERRLTVTEGYAEVSGDRVRILATAAERAEEIDVGRAEQARDRAETRLHDWEAGDETIDQPRALAALRRALARLEVAGKGA